MGYLECEVWVNLVRKQRTHEAPILANQTEIKLTDVEVVTRILA
jgi:hypothetical protein